MQSLRIHEQSQTPAPIDLKNMIGLSTARLLMRSGDGRYPSVETLRRWADPTRGCAPAGRRGPTIYLKAIHHHGVLLTCRAWLEEFDKQRQAIGAAHAIHQGEEPR